MNLHELHETGKKAAVEQQIPRDEGPWFEEAQTFTERARCALTPRPRELKRRALGKAVRSSMAAQGGPEA